MSMDIKIISENKDYVVCVKPAGMISEDVPGGMPELLQKELNCREKIYAVHRLDKATSGLMVYAKNKNTAALLANEILQNRFQKEYLAVIHGCPDEERGTYRDYLFHDTKTNKTYVAKTKRNGTKEAILDYEVLEKRNILTLVRVCLQTGRTHQIRAQFAARKMPLYGDGRYGAKEKAELALWSYRLCFLEEEFSLYPNNTVPWSHFCMGDKNDCSQKDDRCRS